MNTTATTTAATTTAVTEADEAPPLERADRPAGRRGLVLAGIVLATLALAATVVFGMLWFDARHDDSLAFSQAREDALRAAEQGAVNFTTLDYRDVRHGLDRWKQSATGDLYGQLTQGGNAFAQQVQQAKAVTVGTVREAAVTELDPHAGRATVMLVVDVTVTPAGAKPQTKRLPLQEQLTRTDAGWKLSALGQIPVGTAGQ